MSDPTALPKFEFERVLRSDAAALRAAREQALVIHATRDVDAAGDEVEQAARAVLRRKLPQRYHVGHGHVVDASLATSPQLDVVIADTLGTPSLFRTANETEYFPYESVYAVGEVKSGYYPSKRYVHAFVETLGRIRARLARAPTPPDYVPGVRFGHGFQVTGTRNVRNPLFSFMLFVDGGDFKPADLAELYSSRPVEELPNVLCLLNRGLVVNALVAESAAGELELLQLDTHPELVAGSGENRWVFVSFGEREEQLGITFGFLFFALVQHLGTCVLMPPDVLEYMSRIFMVKQKTPI